MDGPWGTTPTFEEFLEELAFADEKLEFFEGRIIAFAVAPAAKEIMAPSIVVEVVSPHSTRRDRVENLSAPTRRSTGCKHTSSSNRRGSASRCSLGTAIV